MGLTVVSRRNLIAVTGAFALSPHFGLAKDIVDLEWTDLVPEGQDVIPPALQSLLEHDESLPASRQPVSSGVRTDWNGQTVRLPGFILPIDFSGLGVTAFILVPFVGACVHVPPPPANQLVFVTSEDPYESSGMYEPVNVIGTFGTAATSTELADVAYAMTAERIEPY